MKRPWSWRRWLLMGCAILVVVEYGTLTVIAPHYILDTLQHVVGGDLRVGKARLALPLTTILHELYYTPSTPQSTLRAKQIIIKPRWAPSASGEVQIQSLRVEQPFVRISRTEAGTLLWPHPNLPASVSSLPERAGEMRLLGWQLKGALRVRIESLRVVDGTLEWIDESQPTPVHLVLEHISFELGPLTVPFTGAAVSTALRAAVVGPTGDPSPLYCSGWLSAASRNMDVSCRLDPMPLSIFEPYFQRRPVIRFYGSTLKTDTRWIAQGNQLTGRMQLELGRLTEGDISVRGITIIDARQLAGDDPDPKLTGELNFQGPLDTLDEWRGRFLPTNVPAQRLVDQLLERKIKALKIPLGPKALHAQLVLGHDAQPSDSEGLTKEITEALELLASPVVPPEPPILPPAEEVPAAEAMPSAVAPEAVPQ